MSFEPDTDGHMLVYGTSGAGKSAALRTIATAAGARPDLGGGEVYGLDFGAGALRSLEALPHVGVGRAGRRRRAHPASAAHHARHARRPRQAVLGGERRRT